MRAKGIDLGGNYVRQREGVGQSLGHERHHTEITSQAESKDVTGPNTGNSNTSTERNTKEPVKGNSRV